VNAMSRRQMSTASRPQVEAALERRRRGRNLAMLVVLLALVALFYAIAMVKMAQVGHLP
jgi:hypothetical protein